MAKLSDHFRGVSAKRLSAVETRPSTSNQHEFNGTKAMIKQLGPDRAVLPARFIYIGTDEEDRLHCQGEVTWYDARENHPSRTEHRLYFRDNEVMDLADENDVLIAAVDHQDQMLLVVVSETSELLSNLLWLFGLDALPGTRFETVDTDAQSDISNALLHYVAEQAGIEIAEETSDEWLELMLSRFGSAFPTTRELSALALETLRDDLSPCTAPDDALMDLLDREELMFRQLERHIVSEQLEQRASNWVNNVDDFISFSLSVQNRRKSRAGHSLENHLEWVFAENSLQFERGAHTESRSKPDFLLPGSREYKDPNWPQDELLMLGVKTTCKDRWRQVLNEAKRIPDKHLLTLQPGISSHQTDEMAAARLTLVVPAELHSTYSDDQRRQLLDLQTFIELATQAQRKRN